MEQGTSTRPTWQEMTIGLVVSSAVNVGYLLIAPHDQRILLMLMFTTVVGMGMLFGLRSGAYGMGALLGVAAAIAIVLMLGVLGHWHWLQR